MNGNDFIAAQISYGASKSAIAYGKLERDVIITFVQFFTAIICTYLKSYLWIDKKCSLLVEEIAFHESVLTLVKI